MHHDIEYAAAHHKAVMTRARTATLSLLDGPTPRNGHLSKGHRLCLTTNTATPECQGPAEVAPGVARQVCQRYEHLQCATAALTDVVPDDGVAAAEAGLVLESPENAPGGVPAASSRRADHLPRCGLNCQQMAPVWASGWSLPRVAR